MSNVVRSSKRS